MSKNSRDLGELPARKKPSKVRVLNLNVIIVATTIADEEKRQAYKTGRIAEMSLKQAGLKAKPI